MRMGELHHVFGLSQYEGLADYLSFEQGAEPLNPITDVQRTDMQTTQAAADIAIDNVIHPSGIEYIDFIPRGKHPNNPASLLISERFDALFTELKARYDYIIIDSPPVLAASDAMLLAQYADQVLMVARYDNSMERQLTYAVKQMQESNIYIDGIVLNDVKQGLMGKYSYHYSYAYGSNR